MCVCLYLQSRVWLSCYPTDCSPPGSSVHGIFQQKYWSGGDLPGQPECPAALAGGFSWCHWAAGEAQGTLRLWLMHSFYKHSDKKRGWSWSWVGFISGWIQETYLFSQAPNQEKTQGWELRVGAGEGRSSALYFHQTSYTRKRTGSKGCPFRLKPSPSLYL